MRLSVMERLVLQNLLPKEGNFTNLKLVRIAHESLSFDDEETKLLKFEQIGENNDQIKWEDNVVGEKEIELGEVATTMIVEALKKLNEDKKLSMNYLSLYEKFIEDKEHG